jgi:hypothetical protein
MKIQPHDTFCIEGVNAVQPITGADTGIPQRMVVVSVEPFRFWPLFMPDGPYRNVTKAPTPDSRITQLNDVPVAERVTWADLAGHESR